MQDGVVMKDGSFAANDAVNETFVENENFEQVFVEANRAIEGTESTVMIGMCLVHVRR